MIRNVAPSKVRSYELGFTSAPVPAWTVSGAADYIQNSDETKKRPSNTASNTRFCWANGICTHTRSDFV